MSQFSFSKNDFAKTNLFSCPIYNIRIDPNLYDKEKIIKDILYNKNLKNTRNDPHQFIGSASDIHHSYLDFNNEDFRIINYEKLSVVYLEIFKEFFSKELFTTKESFGYEFEIVNYSAITEGQWLPVHNHIDFDDFATVHYLNFKEDHNLTIFKNPAIFAPYIKHIRPKIHNIANSKISDNSYLYEWFTIPVKEDDMIIFPAALDHEIAPQGPTKEPRITISSNIKINKI